MSIALYHQMKCVEIICSKIEVIYQNIHLRIDIYTFISKLINNILFFFITRCWDIQLSSISCWRGVQKQDKDEEDDSRGSRSGHCRTGSGPVVPELDVLSRSHATLMFE